MRLSVTWSTWLWVLVSVVSVMSETDTCPQPCSCTADEAGDMDVRCLDIDTVPAGYPDHTKNITIIFSSQPAGGLPAGAFSDLQDIEVLDIQGDIGVIHQGAFDGISGGDGELSTLIIGSANISSIESGAFTNIDNLTVINIWGANIDVIRSHAFADVADVLTVVIAYSHVGQVDPEAFSGLQNVNEIRWERTNIGTLSAFAFKGASDIGAFVMNTCHVQRMYNFALTGMSGTGWLKLWGLQVQCPGEYAFLSDFLTYDLRGNTVPGGIQLHAKVNVTQELAAESPCDTSTQAPTDAGFRTGGALGLLLVTWCVLPFIRACA